MNKSGGLKSEELRWISSEIVAWCEPRAMSLNAVFLLGAQNTVADQLSRAYPNLSDWKPDPMVFDHLRASWSLNVDLIFASLWNRQLE
jgi:hypothetical protein